MKANSNIVIVDYGMGNLFSVKKKLDILGANVVVSSSPSDLLNAEKIILPGVGHFKKAMDNLNELGIIDALNEAVLVKKTPVMGICLGMQIMTSKSEEGDATGLGWFDASIKKFQLNDQLKYKVPHTGWNQVFNKKETALLDGIEDGSEFYFVHAYHLYDVKQADILHTTDYETEFVSAIEKDNMIGVQYHPEKSHDVGEKMLRNFIKNY